MPETSGVATDFRVGGQCHDLKTFLPALKILFLLSFMLLHFVNTPEHTDYVTYDAFLKTKTRNVTSLRRAGYRADAYACIA